MITWAVLTLLGECFGISGQDKSLFLGDLTQEALGRQIVEKTVKSKARTAPTVLLFVIHTEKSLSLRASVSFRAVKTPG